MCTSAPSAKPRYCATAPKSRLGAYVSSSRRVNASRRGPIGAASLPIAIAIGVKLNSIHAFRDSRTALSGVPSPPLRASPDPTHSPRWFAWWNIPSHSKSVEAMTATESAHHRAYRSNGTNGLARGGKTKARRKHHASVGATSK